MRRDRETDPQLEQAPRVATVPCSDANAVTAVTWLCETRFMYRGRRVQVPCSCRKQLSEAFSRARSAAQAAPRSRLHRVDV